MPKEYFVAKVQEIGDRVLFETDDNIRIGIFRVKDKFYAYENRCAHTGGPVCEGVILGRYEQVLAEDKTIKEERFSEDELHVVCPWHGWEFDLETGRCAADQRYGLRSFKVEVRGEDVYVHA